MLHVRDLMERDVATLDAEDTLDLADDVMRLGRVRHFPVMSGGRLVGMLSQRDLSRGGLPPSCNCATTHRENGSRGCPSSPS